VGITRPGGPDVPVRVAEVDTAARTG